MKKLIAVAVLALIGATTAEAKVHELRFGGRTARIEIPKGCKKISCIRVNEKSTRSKRRSAEPSYEEPENQQSNQQPVYQPRANAQPSQAPTAAEPAAVAPQAAAPAQTARTGAIAPGMAPGMAPAPAAPQAEPQAQQTESTDDRKAMARLALPGQAAEEVKPAVLPNASPVARAPDVEPQRSAAPSPVGLWLTQKKEAKIRVVECGSNICGHVEGKPSEKVLINMKPTGGNRWNGTIHDIRRGGNYSAHISLKGSDALKVTGCAFGGMFCGGETWTRAQ